MSDERTISWPDGGMVAADPTPNAGSPRPQGNVVASVPGSTDLTMVESHPTCPRCSFIEHTRLKWEEVANRKIEQLRDLEGRYAEAMTNGAKALGQLTEARAQVATLTGQRDWLREALHHSANLHLLSPVETDRVRAKLRAFGAILAAVPRA